MHRRGGPIPVGDAAGAVSPLTAGGLDPCLRMSQLAAAVTGDYLHTGDASVLRHYDGTAMRARFRDRLLLRDVLSRVREPATAEPAFRLLRTPLGRAAASHLHFGDGSFPDTRLFAAPR